MLYTQYLILIVTYMIAHDASDGRSPPQRVLQFFAVAVRIIAWAITNIWGLKTGLHLELGAELLLAVRPQPYVSFAYAKMQT